MIMPVILWTDALIFLLLAVIIGFIFYARRKEHLRAPWRQIVHQPLGMASAVVLLAYLSIGLLDSLHFHPRLSNGSGNDTRYSSEVLSVFDALTTTLRERVEKTYSAPFATHLYAKEMRQLADGRQVQEYPRLQFGGVHLTDPDGRDADVMKRLSLALFKTLGVWLVLVMAVVVFVARRQQWTMLAAFIHMAYGQTAIPWRSILLTLLIWLGMTWISIDLSTKYHLLGTDKVGQDVFYQALKSIRTGLVIGTLTTLVMLPFAVMLGIMAGYFGGIIDDVIQYLYTTLNSIPGVLLIAAAVLMLQVYMANHAEQFDNLTVRADIRLLFLCIILGVTSWTGLCRLLRGETLKLREVDYIQAAQAFGVSNLRIITRHILPNVMHIVLISVVLDFSGLVLAEAVLSYINIGVDPSMNSWGNMINGARLELARDPLVWWSLLAAFVFMFGLVLSANLFADAVRDGFDPRLTSR